MAPVQLSTGNFCCAVKRQNSPISRSSVLEIRPKDRLTRLDTGSYTPRRFGITWVVGCDSVRFPEFTEKGPRTAMSTKTIQINKAEGGSSLATFDPVDVSLNAGDSLQWYNSDDEPHWPAILSVPQKQWWFPEAAISSKASSPATASFAPPSDGTTPYKLTYNCSLHPKEQGTITVFPQA